MAHQDQEVEIKIKVDKSNFESAEKIAKKIAKPHKKSHQIDEYFSPSHRDFLKPKYPFEWLRIGRRGEDVILNYKHFHPENTKNFTHCDEFETKIESYEKLLKIFKALDLKKIETVDKKRACFIYQDKFEIAFDQVKDLGYFIEIEALKNFNGVKNTNKKLIEFAKKLGLKNFEPEKRGYPYLLLEKKKLI